VIVLRESGLQNYRPRFRAPLYPWVQIVGIGGLGFVILEMGEQAFLISALLIAVGFGAYWFYGRPRVQRESALLHLIQRITDKKLVTGSLEAELKDVIRERDEIVLDRFDRLVEKSAVLDLEEGLSAEAFFARVAEALASRIGTSAATLRNRLLERERESSTVLRPGLAIPHVVIDGEKTFEVLLARSRQGIRFSEDAPPVHSAFVLVGTRDERNFHLRALSAIAQIVQSPGFEKKWLAARGEQALRDAVLLGERKRE
jgi:mannitol/fructose-specific phosphotransferase system IIA component (Ntr-type)